MTLLLAALFSVSSFAQTAVPTASGAELTREQRMQISNKFLVTNPEFFKSVKLDFVTDDMELMNGDDLECENSPNAPYCLQENEGMVFE